MADLSGQNPEHEPGYWQRFEGVDWGRSKGVTQVYPWYVDPYWGPGTGNHTLDALLYGLRDNKEIRRQLKAESDQLLTWYADGGHAHESRMFVRIGVIMLKRLRQLFCLHRRYLYPGGYLRVCRRCGRVEKLQVVYPVEGRVWVQVKERERLWMELKRWLNDNPTA